MTTFSDQDWTETEAQVVLQKVTVAVKLLESVCDIRDAVKKLKNHPIHLIIRLPTMKLKLIHFIAFIIALFGLSPICAESLAKAEFEYDAKNFIAAFEIWNEQAKLDEPAALSGLGQLYLFGQGVAKDEKYAFNLSKKAAELGDARGQSTLGLIFYWGHGIPKDYTQAAYWYQKAANLNRHQAQYNLAWMYQYGQGVPQDFQQAVVWSKYPSEPFPRSKPPRKQPPPPTPRPAAEPSVGSRSAR